MIKALIGGVLAGCVFAGAAAQAQAPSYRLTATVPLGAPDRWDYVVFDAHPNRVYVAHGDRVSVVDADSLSLVGQITGMPGGTHGIAISPANGRGVTDDGEGGKAVVFDVKTLKVVAQLPAAQDADAVARDPLTGHIYTVNGDTGTLTVVDPKAAAVVATIKPGGKLEYATADGTGKLYVNGAGNSEIVRIDTATNAVDARWPVPDCTSPHGMAIDPVGHRVFTSCVNGKLVVVNTDTGREVASLPIGAGTDAAGYDPVRKRVFSSNGRDGTLSVIQQLDADTYRVLDTVKTAVSGRTMGLDPATGRVFIVAADIDPSSPPTGRAKFKPGSMKLLVFSPAP